MHDLHLADKITKLVLQNAQKNSLKQVTKIYLELGDIFEHGENILPENLKFNINLLTKGSVAEGTEIIVKKIKGVQWKLKEIEGE